MWYTEQGYNFESLKKHLYFDREGLHYPWLSFCASFTREGRFHKSRPKSEEDIKSFRGKVTAKQFQLIKELGVEQTFVGPQANIRFYVPRSKFTAFVEIINS